MGCKISLKIRGRRHRPWLQKVSVSVLPFAPSHVSNISVKNVTCFAGSTFSRAKLYPGWQKRPFSPGFMCPLIPDQAWHLNWPGFFFFFFHFHPHWLWLGRGFRKPSRPGHVLLHPPGEGEETDPAPVGRSRLKMCHFHRVGGVLAVGGSTTLAVQGNRSSSGGAGDFQMTCRELRTTDLLNLSLGAQGVAAACAGLTLT